MPSNIYHLENEYLVVGISPKGAELQRVFGKKDQVEYMWNGDAAFWSKHSPVLFPIVGALKHDTYYFNDKTYQLGRHGFARDMEFVMKAQSSDRIVCTLESNSGTLLKYPFAFRFDISYELLQNSIRTTYRVSNTGKSVLYFSVGGHPAFRVPLTADTAYTDYYLEFNQRERAGRWPISKEGLIENKPVELLNDTNLLPLTKELFQKDALVFKGLSSNNIALKSSKTKHGLTLDFTGFPYLGIWAAKGADFVCIEPWCGIADSTDTNQQLTTKEGIHSLQAAKDFERTWSVTVF
jgi:galactose mutarotase-like enzyme